MKKRLLAAAFLGSMFNQAQAAKMFGDISGIVSEVKEYAVYAFVIGFIFMAVFNSGHFFGRDADYKKGFGNLGIYVVVVSAIVGIVAYLETIKF